MKANKYSAKKAVAFIFCLFMILAVCCTVSFAEEECQHADGFEWVVTEQTCTSEGKRELVCRTCGFVDESYTEIIPAHFYEVAFASKVANCVEDGLNVEYCSVCMTYRTVVVPADPSNHNYGEWIVDYVSTCTTQGERHRVCRRSGCTAPIQTEKLPLDYTAHVAAENAEWALVTGPTCAFAGVETTPCAECGKPVYRDIPSHIDASDGSLNEADFAAKYLLSSEVPGTCAKPGVKNYVCQSCGTNVPVATEIDPENHNFTDSQWNIKTPATCTTEGVRYKTCKNDYRHTLEEYYLEDHDYSIEVSFTAGATCTAEGSKVVKCSVCSGTTTVAIPAEHLYGAWDFEDGSSCRNGGTATRTCPCNNTETIEFKAGTHLNHTVITDMKPTCTNNGHKVIYCSDCDANATIIPEGYGAKGHNLGNWVIEKVTSCSEAGYRTRTCRTCSQVIEAESVPMTDHTFHVFEPGVEATCTKSGVSPYLLCTRCFTEVLPENIAPTGHNFVKQSMDGDSGLLICDRCFEYQVDGDETCSCLCHNTNGIAKAVYKVVAMFNKLFGRKQFCDCGIQHYEDTTIFEDLFGPLLGMFGG